MESEDQFYLSLPSSASMDLHPDNVISDYTTQLLETIHLERETYEIGLSEILLDTKVENVPDKQKAFVVYRNIDYVKNTLGVEGSVGFLTGVEIRGVKYYQEIFYTIGGVYKNLSDLAAYFNMRFMDSVICNDLIFNVHKIEGESFEVLELKSHANADLHDITNFYLHQRSWFNNGIRATSNPYSDAKNLISSGKMHLKLFQRYLTSIGSYMTDEDKINENNTIRFVIDPDELLQGPGMAYIYSDAVEYRHVGDTKAPILRVVHFPQGARVINFPHIQYLPLSKSSIESIRLYIRDVEGKPYPFTHGTALCKVHIRKKRR